MTGTPANAALNASSAVCPCSVPVAIMLAAAAWTVAPHPARKQLVILRKITDRAQRPLAGVVGVGQQAPTRADPAGGQGRRDIAQASNLERELKLQGQHHTNALKEVIVLKQELAKRC
jgi:hypothetical protein